MSKALATQQSKLEAAWGELLSLLHRAAPRFAAARGETALYEALLSSALEAVGADAGVIHLLRDDQLVPVALRGQSEARSLPLADDSLPGLAARSRKTLIANPRRLPRPLRRPGEPASLAVPVRLEADTYAVITLIRRRAARPFGDSDGELVAMLAGQAGPHLQRMAAERLAAVGSLASSMLHDLGNSLTVIRGAGELTEVTSDQAARYSALIQEESNRVSTMMREILDFGEGRNRIERRTVDLASFLHQLIAPHEPLLTRAGIQIQLEVTCESATFDPFKVGRALTNLIMNAREAMPAGGTLTVRALRRGGALLVEVADTGIGMSAEVRQRLFEPFFTHGKPKGTGLGTTVVRSVAESHGGIVDVRSSEGQGTTVAVYLPQPDGGLETRCRIHAA